ncbi:hypothetical protein [Streptomyces sp. ALI-76-A]|uniref:hypothetical protein n=1 Tax=Streptomyces sp. ALI-76-A TaxID=3025736 RepID=UPI00256EDBCF|nr:hypothetical protein [Streptomyces sp. ALI-76-A]MDL5202281.1 hypothetical protein [Streptomyces sp. ALI-76-A]
MEPPTHLPLPDPDPLRELLTRYGVRDMDLWRHGAMSPEQLERLLEGVIRSVLPPKRA